jgi:hypothetical protein
MVRESAGCERPARRAHSLMVIILLSTASVVIAGLYIPIAVGKRATQSPAGIP